MQVSSLLPTTLPPPPHWRHSALHSAFGVWYARNSTRAFYVSSIQFWIDLLASFFTFLSFLSFLLHFFLVSLSTPKMKTTTKRFLKSSTNLLFRFVVRFFIRGSTFVSVSNRKSSSHSVFIAIYDCLHQVKMSWMRTWTAHNIVQWIHDKVSFVAVAPKGHKEIKAIKSQKATRFELNICIPHASFDHCKLFFLLIWGRCCCRVDITSFFFVVIFEVQRVCVCVCDKSQTFSHYFT